jgi:hypothetical protein
MKDTFENPAIIYDKISGYWLLVYKDTVYYRSLTKRECEYQLYLVNNCGQYLEDLSTIF